MGKPHVDHQGRLRVGQALPIEVERPAGAAVPGHEAHAGGQAPVGERNAGAGRTARRRGDAGHDLAGHAVPRQVERLLAAAPEDQRIAALEAHDPVTRPRQRSLVSSCGRECAPLALPA
jgi:hypothetical protein